MLLIGTLSLPAAPPPPAVVGMPPLVF